MPFFCPLNEGLSPGWETKSQLSFRLNFFQKRFYSAAVWEACGHPWEVVFLYQQSITGCGCNGISADWGRWEGCAVKQGIAALFSLWWTVTAAFTVTVNWGRAPSYTLLSVGLLCPTALGTQFLTFHLQMGARRIKPSPFSPTSSAWDKDSLTPSV